MIPAALFLASMWFYSQGHKIVGTATLVMFVLVLAA